MDNRPIGVLDSGLGGLAAVRQLQSELPGIRLSFFTIIHKNRGVNYAQRFICYEDRCKTRVG